MMYCEESAISVSLVDEQLWSQFNQHGTEMIVTKPGRKLFPKLTLSVSGLVPTYSYEIRIVFIRADKFKHRFTNDKWEAHGEEEEGEGAVKNFVHHSDGKVQTGEEWMRGSIEFHHFKLTNNPEEGGKHKVFVQSLHKYVPLVEIYRCNNVMEQPMLVKWVSLDIASFIVVTAYQNDAIKTLKTQHNPFAKGIRNSKMASTSPTSSNTSYSSTDSSTSTMSRKRKSDSPLAITPNTPAQPPFNPNFGSRPVPIDYSMNVQYPYDMNFYSMPSSSHYSFMNPMPSDYNKMMNEPSISHNPIISQSNNMSSFNQYPTNTVCPNMNHQFNIPTHNDQFFPYDLFSTDFDVQPVT